MIKRNKLVPLLISSLFLISCGGGGGSDDDTGGSSTTFSGSTSAATLTDDNTSELAVAAASGAQQALQADDSSAPFRPALATAAIEEALESLLQDILSQRGNTESVQGLAKRTEDLSSSFCDSGSVIADYPDNVAASTSYTGTIVFDNCRSIDYGYDFNFLWDGTVRFTTRESGDTVTETTVFENFTAQYTYNGDTETQIINYSETCTYDIDEEYNEICTVYSDFDGYDGRTYRVSDVSVNGDNTSGYDIDATVYDPDYGYFTIEASDITFCSSGLPGSGSVSYSDGTQTGLVEFLSCTQYQYSWNNAVYGPFNW